VDSPAVLRDPVGFLVQGGTAATRSRRSRRVARRAPSSRTSGPRGCRTLRPTRARRPRSGLQRGARARHGGDELARTGARRDAAVKSRAAPGQDARAYLEEAVG